MLLSRFFGMCTFGAQKVSKLIKIDKEQKTQSLARHRVRFGASFLVCVWGSTVGVMLLLERLLITDFEKEVLKLKMSATGQNK